MSTGDRASFQSVGDQVDGYFRGPVHKHVTRDRLMWAQASFAALIT